MSEGKMQKANQAVEIEDLTVEESAQQDIIGGSGSISSHNLKQFSLACITTADQ